MGGGGGAAAIIAGATLNHRPRIVERVALQLGAHLLVGHLSCGYRLVQASGDFRCLVERNLLGSLLIAAAAAEAAAAAGPKEQGPLFLGLDGNVDADDLTIPQTPGFGPILVPSGTLAHRDVHVEL